MKYKQWNCELDIGSYADNGNIAISLYSWKEGPIATATVNLGIKLPQDEAYIKDYSENEGMLDFLTKEGIVEKIIDYRKSGYVSIPRCKLNLKTLKEKANVQM